MANQNSVKKVIASIVAVCALVVIFVTPAITNNQSAALQENSEMVR